MKLKMTTMALALTIVLAGCSNANNGEPAVESTEPVEQTNAPTEEQSESEAEQTEGNGVEVDKGLLNVNITLPASMFEGQDMDQVIADAKEDGVKEATVNEDGSVTYKMSKSDHKQMLKEMADEIDASIEEMKTDETFTSIKDITHNDSLSAYTITVDKAAYEGSMDGFAAFGLGIQGMYYQIFEGIASDKLKVTIEIKDEATGEIFDTIVYPDAINNE